MPRSGVVGEQTFEQVETLTGEGLTRTQAFAEISKQTGRPSGTVAANYYRVARKRAGGSLRPTKATKAASSGTRSATRGRGRAGASGRGGQAAAGDIAVLASDLVASVQALTAAVKAQDAEVQELRSRLDGVKTLLD